MQKPKAFTAVCVTVVALSAGLTGLAFKQSSASKELSKASTTDPWTLSTEKPTHSKPEWDEAFGPDDSHFQANEQESYGPFVLANGKQVTLKYVMSAGPKVAWSWAPNGKELSAESQKSVMRLFPATTEKQKSRLMILCIDPGMPREAFHCTVRVPHDSGQTGYQIWSDHIRDGDTVEFRAPYNMKRSDVAVGIAFGNFHDYRRCELGSGILSPRIGKQMLDLFPTDNSTYCHGTCVVSVCVPPELRDKDLSVMAYDANGNGFESSCPHEHKSVEDGKEYRGYVLDGPRPDQIKTVDLRFRNYEWANFTGVHLWPR